MVSIKDIFVEQLLFAKYCAGCRGRIWRSVWHRLCPQGTRKDKCLKHSDTLLEEVLKTESESGLGSQEGE